MTESDEHEVNIWLQERVENLLRYSRTSERILGVMQANVHTSDLLEALLKDDPDLEPEVRAAAKNLHNAAQALRRAHTFASARMSAEGER